MLSFEVIHSEDPELSNDFLNYFDHFKIGSSSQADIIINDSLLSALHIKLEVKEESLICKSADSESSFLVNGKKYSGSKVLKVNDELSIGNTKIKITDFSKTDRDLESNLEEQYNSAIEKIPELESVIFQLERELLKLERNKNV